jgi:ketol-acid reductoisomerase
MEAILEEVQSGEFAQEWVTENQANRPKYWQLRAQEENHEIEEVGARLRGLFAWADEEEAETSDEDEDERITLNE